MPFYASRCDPGAPTGYSERRVAHMFHGYVATGCGDAVVSLLGVMPLDNLCETSMARPSTHAYIIPHHCPQKLLMWSSHRQDNKPHPLPPRMQMRHRSPPLPRILKLVHRRLRRRTLTTHILLHKPQPIPAAIKTMLSPQQLDKLVKIQIVDQRPGVASSRVSSAFAAGVVLFAGRGVVLGDVAGRADDAGVAGFAGDEEGF